MCQFFKTCGYPNPVIHNSKHRAQSLHPQSAPLSSHNKLEERILLTLTFHPHNISVKNIILNNFKLLQHDPTTAEIFSQPLLISYKLDKNISNVLVNSTLKSDHTRVRCTTCPFITNANKISGPNCYEHRSFQVHFRQSHLLYYLYLMQKIYISIRLVDGRKSFRSLFLLRSIIMLELFSSDFKAIPRGSSFLGLQSLFCTQRTTILATTP